MQHPFWYFDEAWNDPGEYFEKSWHFHPGRIDDSADGSDVGGNTSVEVKDAVLVGQVARQQDLPASLEDIRVFGQGDDAATGKVGRLAWIRNEKMFIT